MLTLEFRPRVWSDLVGQPMVARVLPQMVREGSLPGALLFAGMWGSGKTSTARILAAHLNCEADEVERPCASCSSCRSVFSTSCPDVIEIDAASHGLVEDMRALRGEVCYTTLSRHRVIVLDEAQAMSRAGYTALLKTLEDPPAHTVFVLVTTEPDKILDAVRSRTMRFDFHGIGRDEVTARLAHIAETTDFHPDPELFDAIAGRCQGAMRDAVMLLDQARAGSVSAPDGLVAMLGETDPGPRLVRAAASGDVGAGYRIVADELGRTGDVGSLISEVAHTLRDVTVVHALSRSGSGDVDGLRRLVTARGDALRERARLAGEMSGRSVRAGLRLCWELRTEVPVELSGVALLDVFVSMLTETIGPEIQDGVEVRTEVGNLVSEVVEPDPGARREPLVEEPEPGVSADDVRAAFGLPASNGSR